MLVDAIDIVPPLVVIGFVPVYPVWVTVTSDQVGALVESFQVRILPLTLGSAKNVVTLAPVW